MENVLYLEYKQGAIDDDSSRKEDDKTGPRNCD